jgi:hypothetical protein
MTDRNAVPGHPDWYYGIGLRGKDGWLTVEVFGPDKQSFEIHARYWADVHTEAVERISSEN